MGKDRTPKSEKRKKKPERGEASEDETTKAKSKLNEEERIWVINLKDELRNCPDLMGVSEWDIACQAIVAKNQPLKAIHRLRRLKKFQQAYKIPQHPTVYEAIKTLHDFCHDHTDFIQAIGQDVLGRWVLSFQLKGLTNVQQQEQEVSMESEFIALYFLFAALQSDLDAVRKGTIWIGDLQDISRRTMPLSLVNGARAMCRDSYPIKVQDAPVINVPPRWSAVYALCRPFFSPHLMEKLVWGCTPELLKKVFPKHVLSKGSLGGTQSQQDILDVLEHNLTRRFDNQESFRLNIL
jgi:hypothetical protein